MLEGKKHQNGITFSNRLGSGATLMFLHGIGSNASSFAPLFGYLPTEFNLIAWNAPGYMDSEPLQELWPLARDYAEVLALFLEKIEVNKVHLIGHSLGAIIATEFASLFPEKVESLILASAANGYGLAQNDELPTKATSRINDLERLGVSEFARTRARNLIHDPNDNEDLVKAVETTMSQINTKGYTQAVRMLASGNIATKIAETKLYPGFIIGAHDNITPLEQTQRAASEWQSVHRKDPRIITIQGAGHAVYVQKPRAFASALLDLIGYQADRPVDTNTQPESEDENVK